MVESRKTVAEVRAQRQVQVLAVAFLLEKRITTSHNFYVKRQTLQ